MAVPRNIIVAGETGVGKSSLINLVIGRNAAETSNAAVGVTLDTTHHEADVGGQAFNMWDTPGLSEGTYGNVSAKGAEQALRSLFTQLNRKDGVHLLILCFRGISKVTKGMKLTYERITDICTKTSPDTPIVAVITELEKSSSSMEEWWKNNQDTFSKYNMTFADHACITTLTDDCHPPMLGRRERCRQVVHNLVLNNSLPPKSVVQKGFHVVLFGETGVGKSSLINLLAGWEIANVSSDVQGCTLDSTEYQFTVNRSTIRVWDTVGLDEPEIAVNSYLGAVEKAIHLIRRLEAVGGISLLIFCMRGNRITATVQSNYRLFYEILGRKEVPVALVITHLERETEMEGWWPRNVKTMERYGIVSTGHACVTTLPGHPKYEESKQAILDLLSQYVNHGKFSMPTEMWIGRLLKGLGSLVTGDRGLKGKDIVRVLTKRCHLDLEVAQRVAAWLE
ncbi:P-loop containing nucleoside triphosphate hydrolase protein [Phlebopus sp. FC_14]|nr:P-loop containing nucleoside triphosphate hydrolase protein [Phlebopus sp. FC_14]